MDEKTTLYNLDVTLLDEFSSLLFPQNKSHAIFIFYSCTIQKKLLAKDCNEPGHVGLKYLYYILHFAENMKRSDLTPGKGLRRANKS